MIRGRGGGRLKGLHCLASRYHYSTVQLRLKIEFDKNDVGNLVLMPPISDLSYIKINFAEALELVQKSLNKNLSDLSLMTKMRKCYFSSGFQNYSDKKLD